MIKYTFTSKGSAGFPHELVNYNAIQDYIYAQIGWDGDSSNRTPVDDILRCMSTILDDKGNARGLMVLTKDTILAGMAARYISGLLINHTLSFRCDMEYMEELAPNA